MNHTDMLFTRVCVWEIRMVCVCVYKEAPRPPTARTSFRRWRRVGHSPKQLFRRIPHIAKEKTRRGLRKLVGILQQRRGQWGRINPSRRKILLWGPLITKIHNVFECGVSVEHTTRIHPLKFEQKQQQQLWTHFGDDFDPLRGTSKSWLKCSKKWKPFGIDYRQIRLLIYVLRSQALPPAERSRVLTVEAGMFGLITG